MNKVDYFTKSLISRIHRNIYMATWRITLLQKMFYFTAFVTCVLRLHALAQISSGGSWNFW